MPTIEGDWKGSGNSCRIVLVYVREYNADHTIAIFNGDFYAEFKNAVSDSVNTWETSGDMADPDSGSNVTYSFGSGGGRKKFNHMAKFNRVTNPTVRGEIDNVEAVGGGVIGQNFTLPVGNLAPYLDYGYYAASITSVAFAVAGLSSHGNGGTLNNIQVQYGLTQSTSNPIYTRGSYGTPTVTGLTPNKTYWFRVRLSNSTYGWGPWGAWISFATLPGAPGTPGTGWTFTSNSPTTANIGANTVADNGGSAVTGWDVQYNSAPTDVEALLHVGSSPTVAGPLTDLNPSTTYYARIRAKNANGAGPWSAWKSTLSLPGVYICIDDEWVVAEAFIKVGNYWKPAKRLINIDGVWKE